MPVPLLVWPAVAGVTGFVAGSALGGFAKSLVRLAVIGGLGYVTYQTVIKK